jgi:MraZ protein
MQLGLQREVVLQSGGVCVKVALELKPRTGVVRLLPPHHSGPNSFPTSNHPLRKDTELAFRGLYEHSLDSKDRLTVPSRFRSSLADGIVLSKGFDPCVWMHTTAEFEDLSDRFLSPHSPFGKDARALRRRFHGGSFDENLDSAGRIRIPKPLIEHAGLDGNCVVIGAGEYLEIWNADAWAKQEEELDAAAPEIAEGLAGAGAA